MANPNAPKQPCTMPGCSEMAVGRGLCQRHYDSWYGKIRRERDKLKNRELPFLKFENPYRLKSGYHIVFEVIRNNKPLTEEQITRISQIELLKAGISNYRIDYALGVLKCENHSSKKGDYRVVIDEKDRWILTKESK